MRDLIVGDTIDQYQLTDLLARGGMASIFKAVDTDSGMPVVLKIPYLQYESDVVFFERFRREEETGQRLRHPNVVEVLRPREKSRMYMAMEYVDGKSLRSMLDGKHPLPTGQALEIARQVCDGLAYLHDHRVVHRDIKPENILLTASGQVKILDFGIALAQAARRLTWAGLAHALGTPDYMAPEQIRGRRGDARTDVYALGTMLYEMLTCKLPYDGPSSLALLRAKKSDEPRSPSHHVPEFDASLEAIILKAIARSPRDRYSTASELLADLRNPSAVPPRDPGVERARPREGGRFRRRLAVSVVLAAILAALASLIGLSHGYSVEPRPTPEVSRETSTTLVPATGQERIAR